MLDRMSSSESPERSAIQLKYNVTLKITTARFLSFLFTVVLLCFYFVCFMTVLLCLNNNCTTRE